MNNEYYGAPVQNANNEKKQGAFGIIFLIPILVLVIFFMIVPIVQTIIRSFYNNNMFINSEFIGLENYNRLFSDPNLIRNMINSIITTLISTLLTVEISFLFAWLASKVQKVFRILLCSMFLIVSVTTIIPNGINVVINSRGVTSGLVNSTVFPYLIAVLVPFLIGIGPLFLLFTIYFMQKDNFKKYLHIAASMQIIICFLSFFSIRFIIGSPVHRIVNLLGSIYNEALNNRRIGYAGAIAIVMGAILVLLFILVNGIVLIIGMICRSLGTDKQSEPKKINPFAAAIITIILFIISLILMYPFLKTIGASFKVENQSGITLDNYKEAINLTNQGMHFLTVFLNAILTIIISSATMLFISIIGGIGFTMLGSISKRILTGFVLLTFLLSPIVMMYFSRSSFNITSILSNALPMTFQSISFGLGIFISSKLMESCSRNYNKLSDIMSSGKTILRCLFGVLSISAIASLAEYFNPIYFPAKPELQSLYQLQQRFNFSPMPSGVNSSLLVLTMIMPIGIIVLFTTVLLVCFNSNTTKPGDAE